MRFILLLLCVLITTGLQADELSNRLRLALPGEDAPTVNERQYLYQRFSELFTKLEGDKVRRKRTKKQIRRIKDRLQRDFLRTYKAGARLADAFRVGAYNDATAALLAALVFEEFDITYEGYVDHWEAYLIADPEKRADKVFHPDHEKHDDKQEAAFRRHYIELVRAVGIDDVSSAQDELEKTFIRYYYSSARRLSFGQLTAFLQYRRAQAAYADSNFVRAIELLDIAMLKEERPAFLVLRKAAELQLKARTQPDVEGSIVSLFAQWAEAPENKYLPAAILQHFDERQRMLLAENRAGQAAELLAEYLAKAPAGKTAWSDDMNNLQRYRLLQHHFTSGNMDQARRLADQLHTADPTNESLKYILAEIILDDLRRRRLQGVDFIKAITDAAAQYPFVRERRAFMDLQLRELAWKVRDDYDTDDGAKGARSLERFRRALLGIGVDEDRSVWTLTAFLAASNYHFRQQEYAQALAFVEEGLQYNAQDAYLLHRQELLRRY